MRPGLGLVAAGLAPSVLACALLAARPALADDLRLDRTVLLMRHGVRSPDRPPAADLADQPWPQWAVKPGWLTAHGEKAVALIGGYDRRRFIDAGLLPAQGCPEAGAVAIQSNTLQRTIRTAEVYANALALDCGVSVSHLPEGTPDPTFPYAYETQPGYDPAAMTSAYVDAIGPDGLAALDDDRKPVFKRLDHILCGKPHDGCGVSGRPSELLAGNARQQPRIRGAVGAAPEPALVLLMEYADGWPMGSVGWGRAKPADVTAVSVLSVDAFRLTARPRSLALLNMATLRGRMLDAMTSAAGARINVIVAHDGNIESLAGLLDLHWHDGRLAPDYPTPGGALGFERMADPKGRLYIRAIWRSQQLDQIRDLTPLSEGDQPYYAVVPIHGCRARGVIGLCTLSDFKLLMRMP